MIAMSEVTFLSHLAITMLFEMATTRSFILRIYISIRVRISCIYMLAYIELLYITYIVLILLHLHRVSSGYNPI
jgi:hypothetical protein